jgi:PAS domain S-box-containing protein
MLLNTRKIQRGSGKEQILLLAIEDITDRKLAEEALNISETRYRSLFESAKDGILILDSGTGRIVDVNPILIHMLGYSKKQFINKTIWEIGVFKEIVANQDSYLEFQKKGYNRYEHLPLETKDGRRIDIEFVSHVNIAHQQKVTQCNIRDITEHIQIEELLRESEEKYRILSELSPEMIYLVDTNGCITYLNKAGGAQFRVNPSEIVGKHITDVFPPDIANQNLTAIQKVIDTKTPFYNEREMKFPFGNMWVSSRLSPVFDKEYQVVSVLGLSIDITQRKHAEENLRESEKRFKELTTHLPQSVFEADLNGIITFANDFASETFGYSKEEVLNIINYRMIVVPEERDKLSENARKIINGNLQTGGEYTALRKDGTIFPCLVYVNAIMSDEKPVGIRGILVDISEIKKAEQELIKAKEKAESANKLKDAFIANISHEIRTPLNGIIGMSSLIKEIFQDKINEEDKELFAGIDYSSKRLISTVDMILNYSRLQVGEFPLFRKNLELSAICVNLVTQYTTTAKNKSVNLSFQNNCGDANLFTDENSITMAISNLIDNAIKYTDIGFISVILHKEINDDIILDVTDTGVGISEESLENIFEPYHQEQMGYGRAYEGIGLGLSLAKKVLELNDAKIIVKSKKGKGTTFSINFGKGVQSVDEMHETDIKVNIPPPKEGTVKYVVLLVEDDIMNQATIKRFLGIKYTTLMTNSSDEALEILHKNKVDLILMDISIMGHQNGLELTKDLKASKEFSNIPVIAITAHAFEKDKQNVLEAGCDSYLAKPFTKESLLEMVAGYAQK